MVRRYRSPSLLILFCGSLSPEFLRPGRNPRKQPTSRLFRNRYGSSIVSTYVSAICVPTPFTCLSKDTSGCTSWAIFSIRSSYSLMRSFSDSISLSNGSRTSRNSALNPAPSPRLTCCVPHLGSRSHKTSPTPALRSPRPFEHSPVRPALGLPSDGFALAHCDAAPAPTARGRFAAVVPVFAHRVDHLFDCFW